MSRFQRVVSFIVSILISNIFISVPFPECITLYVVLVIVGCITLPKYFEILYGDIPSIDTTALMG